MIRRSTFAASLLALAGLAFPSPASAQQFVYPLTGWITQGYWTRVWYRASGFHQALDISSFSGGWKLIGAGRRGTVGYSGWGGSFGWLVILNHGAGYQTYYGHSWRLLVRRGWGVRTNQNIMYEGSSGLSSGPHTHWEFRRWNVPQYVPGWRGNWVGRGRILWRWFRGLSRL